MREVLEGKYFAVVMILKCVGENNLEAARQRLEVIFDCFRGFSGEEQLGCYVRLGQELNVLLYYKAQEYKVNFIQARDHYLQVDRQMLRCYTAAQWEELLYKVLDSYCTLIHANSRRDYSNLIRDCLDYIDRYYAQPLTVEGEARRLNVSRSYLSHRFVQEMGCSFTDHVNSTRIRYACDLLAKLQFPIQRIADAAGFSSSNYFARTFRKHMGMTPSQYREKMQGGRGKG